MNFIKLICFMAICSLQSCNFYEVLKSRRTEPYPLAVSQLVNRHEITRDSYSRDIPLSLRSFRYCFAQQNNRHPRQRSNIFEFNKDSIVKIFISHFDSTVSNICEKKYLIVEEQGICPDEKDLVRWRVSKRASYASDQIELDLNDLSMGKYVLDVFFWYNLYWIEETETSDLVPGLNQTTGELRLNRDLYLLVIISHKGEIVYRNGNQGFDRQLVKDDEDPELDVPESFIHQLVSKTMEEFNDRRK